MALHPLPNHDMNASSEQFDVTILGGGLAGLTCALHCLKESPEAKILVLEKGTHPVPEAAHKIGESSVEVGAHYFREFLGLEEHLENEQIPKMGLRLFFDRGDNSRIDTRLELGGTDFPPAPSYQFDRGRFENYLGERVRSLGMDFRDGTRVKNVELNGGRSLHEIDYESEGEAKKVFSRWVVDATGRAGFLKKKLGLKKECSHKANSAWLRIGKRVKVDDWSADAEWQKNFSEDHPRWMSTNHLLGEGYWIWIIPLASGSTSIGIVADEGLHPLSGFNSLEKMLAWIEEREPQLAADLRENESLIQDFSAIKRYSMECGQMYSTKRWGIVGDAGFFIDPFYSPGNDFIALSNSFVCELIKRDLMGKSNMVRVPLYNHLFGLFFNGTGLIFKENYPLFGNHQVMPIKILWDWMVYWTITGHVFIQGRLCKPGTYARHMLDLKKLNTLNYDLQAHFRRWNKEKPNHEIGGTIDTSKMCFIMDANRRLIDELNDKEFSERFAFNVAQMETLFWEIVDHSGLEIETSIKRRKHDNVVHGGINNVFSIVSQKPESTEMNSTKEGGSMEEMLPKGEAAMPV